MVHCKLLNCKCNSPFYYEPHPQCVDAARSVVALVNAHPEWMAEVKGGKTFGVMVCNDGSVLRAYSGQLLGSYAWENFVPPVFDYLEPDGYFKCEESAIIYINKVIGELASSAELRAAREALYEAEKAKPVLPPSRPMPDDEALREAYIRERQHEKGEYRRAKARWNELVEAKREALQQLQNRITALKQERKSRSDALQQWLFDNFVMLNANGESKSISDIFRDWSRTTGSRCVVPPSGSGECCAPKLFQFAYQKGLVPIAIAEFTFGGCEGNSVTMDNVSWRGACQSRCAPILQWMLQGLDVEENALTSQEERTTLDVLYEDDRVVVVNKPAGMLSVPGKSSRRSAQDVLCSMRPECPDLRMVHRLDMQTSGILVAAKSADVYRELQRLFAMHGGVEKMYMAVLDGRLGAPVGTKGEISLPLAADYLDRPRQKVDFENGKPSLTRYEIVGEKDGCTLLKLWPVTGRTHQLRVHCAHEQGFGVAIKGDDLYGTHASRLYLHATHLSIPQYAIDITSLPEFV